MSGKPLALVAVAAAALVLGYVGVRAIRGQSPTGEATARRMLDLAARGDTAALGALVHLKCRRAGDARKQCYEDAFVTLAAGGG